MGAPSKKEKEEKNGKNNNQFNKMDGLCSYNSNTFHHSV